MKKVLKVFSVVLLLVSMINITGCKKEEKSNKITIMATSFPGYDVARAITKESNNIEVKMLLKPGSETHVYEPTPKDIKNISNSKLFIYVGGDSDEWVSDILKNINTKKTKVVKLIDLVDLVKEEEVEGMEEHDEEEEEEDDEHVWTSPKNYIEIINQIKEEIVKIDSDNKKLYEKNANNYINELNGIDKEIRDIVKNSKRKELLFGDRFPLRYFTDEYKLKYYAAFPGCSEQTEASAKTIAFLSKKVREDKIPVVLHIELSNGKIANTIAKETGAKVLEFNSAHNITQKDFDNNITYIDLMKRNIKVLKEALN